MSDIGQEVEDKPIKFIWCPVDKKPELELNDNVTIDDLIKHEKINNENFK